VTDARRCPNCTQALRALCLAGHYERQVEIDLCGPCRLVWFDPRESMQLSGLGWIGLLEQLGNTPPAARPWRGQALGCPCCRRPLRAQRNQTRWGLFVTSVCPQAHGSLQSHAALLAERGLLRTPTAADREAMARAPRDWACLNCGASIADAQVACSFCDTPLLLFDLERLASALLPRAHERAVEPGGRLDVWPCQACGFALDPTVQRSCPQCGQTVLARSLSDLQPLLRRLREQWQAWRARPQPMADPADEAQRVARARPHWLALAARRLATPPLQPVRAVRRFQLALAVALLLLWWWLYR
jgi:ribosomal protein S27AE